MTSSSENRPRRERWEEEVLAGHRWGQHGDRASAEHARLRKLWETVPPLTAAQCNALDGVIALEICNWNLEESTLALCEAIGKDEPTRFPIGHMDSISDERWQRVWGYYLTLRSWLLSGGKCGHEALLKACDPDGKIRSHVSGLLGDRNHLKELYVERLCLCLEFWLGGFCPRGSAQMKAHSAAVSAVEKEIGNLDPDGQILGAMSGDGDGRLQPCGHKAFRRYDIILSSIGAGRWRGAMPVRGTDGWERAETLESYLSPIQAWIDGDSPSNDEVAARVHKLLDKRDDTKVFLASLLVSLLGSQQLAARQLAESRSKQP